MCTDFLVFTTLLYFSLSFNPNLKGTGYMYVCCLRTSFHKSFLWAQGKFITIFEEGISALSKENALEIIIAIQTDRSCKKKYFAFIWKEAVNSL